MLLEQQKEKEKGSFLADEEKVFQDSLIRITDTNNVPASLFVFELSVRYPVLRNAISQERLERISISNLAQTSTWTQGWTD